MNFLIVQLAVAGVLYGAACVVSFVSLYKNGRSEGPIFYLLAFAGFAAHTFALVSLGLKTGRIPLGNAFEMMAAVAWMFVAVDFCVVLLLRLKIVGSLSVCAACVLTLLPLLCPAFSPLVGDAPEVAVNFAAVHGLLAVLSYSFLALSSVFGTMYALQNRSLKNRQYGALTRSLLPLPRLVKFARLFLGLACLVMAASLVIGVVAAFHIHMTFSLAVKFAAGGVLFVLMLTLLWFASKRNIGEGLFAKLCIALFVFSIIIIVPIQLRSLGL